MNTTELHDTLEAKMRAAGVARPAIGAFLKAVQKVVAGDRGLLSEAVVEPVTTLPEFEQIPDLRTDARALLRQLAVIKLNGGLGTGMGLETVKSLIPVKGPDTFLDFIARQILHLRGLGGGAEPAFFLMDSFSTRQDTLDHLRKFPELGPRDQLDFLQSMVPKLDAASFAPIAWPPNPELEWCPPGHGDLYPSLLGSGLLDRLLAAGVKYLFVSNSDNLGATLDLKLVRYFAESGLSFLMEVARRTAADRKGGHLGRSRTSGRLLLRESAQCPKEDEAAFQDIERHRFFNTNNLWLRLDHLKAELDRQGGSLPLPLITNSKTVDPKDPNSPKVIQLESAMGAAIECFERSGAVVVPRTRFAPVKTTSDLLALRSDAYRVTDDFCLVLDASRRGQPPVVELDARYYRIMADFDGLFTAIPSLQACDQFIVSGPIRFGPGIICGGKVEFANASSTVQTAPAGTYRDCRVAVGPRTELK